MVILRKRLLVLECLALGAVLAIAGCSIRPSAPQSDTGKNNPAQQAPGGRLIPSNDATGGAKNTGSGKKSDTNTEASVNSLESFDGAVDSGEINDQDIDNF